MTGKEQPLARFLYILAIIVAGEMVFGLPFHTARFFRPTLLDAFGYSNTQLGDLFAVYGVTAMLSYFPGGALADRFSARALLSTSLIATAAGGLYMATFPGPAAMAALYGYWGVTTIFLFWGALIRATREWGGKATQGVAFGILEGGRGLVAALVGAAMVIVLANFMPADVAQTTPEERRYAFRFVILGYSTAAFLAGVVAWLVIPDPGETPKRRRNPFPNMLLVIREPIVWAQAFVVICAYCCFKAADNYSLYAVQVLGMNEVEGARLASYGAYIRPVAAVAAGLLADRFDPTRAIGSAFALLTVVYLMLSSMLPETTGLAVIYANFAISLFAVFSLRGIYFALLQETRTPRHITGAAVGMISLVGYTPEVFFAPIAGRILDATPGAGGHLDLFRLLAVITACGVIVIAWLLWLKKNQTAK
jgi:nitrate/nitrite transporter NarK